MTDCESLVKRIHNNKLPKADHKRHHSVLLRSLLTQARHIHVPIIHVHSHADRDRHILDCTRDQQDNITADRVAANDRP